MVNPFYKKMDGPLGDRRGFAIQSLNSMTGARRGNQPSTRPPTLDTATGPRHGHLLSTQNLARFDRSTPPIAKERADNGIRRIGGRRSRLLPGRAAALSAAERTYEASPCALVSCREAPVQQQPGATAAAAFVVLVPMCCGRSSACRAMHKQAHESTRHGA